MKNQLDLVCSSYAHAHAMLQKSTTRPPLWYKMLRHNVFLRVVDGVVLAISTTYRPPKIIVDNIPKLQTR